MEAEIGIDMDGIAGMTIGFGGGFGRRGLVCGAISGGVMVIGQKHWRGGERENRDAIYSLTLEVCQRFEDRFGATACYELTGCDLTSEKGRQEFRDGRMKEEKCVHYVGAVIGILMDLLG